MTELWGNIRLFIQSNLIHFQVIELDIGKCPYCEKILTGDDIAEIKFKGSFHTHHAYVCKQCETIIGFGSASSPRP